MNYEMDGVRRGEVIGNVGRLSLERFEVRQGMEGTKLKKALRPSKGNMGT
jgi:hypothetical protein